MFSLCFSSHVYVFVYVFVHVSACAVVSYWIIGKGLHIDMHGEGASIFVTWNLLEPHGLLESPMPPRCLPDALLPNDIFLMILLPMTPPP